MIHQPVWNKGSWAFRGYLHSESQVCVCNSSQPLVTILSEIHWRCACAVSVKLLFFCTQLYSLLLNIIHFIHKKLCQTLDFSKCVIFTNFVKHLTSTSVWYFTNFVKHLTSSSVWYFTNSQYPIWRFLSSIPLTQKMYATNNGLK